VLIIQFCFRVLLVEADVCAHIQCIISTQLVQLWKKSVKTTLNFVLTVSEISVLVYLVKSDHNLVPHMTHAGSILVKSVQAASRFGLTGHDGSILVKLVKHKCNFVQYMSRLVNSG
jgi:hypothetical protein